MSQDSDHQEVGLEIATRSFELVQALRDMGGIGKAGSVAAGAFEARKLAQMTGQPDLAKVYEAFAELAWQVAREEVPS